jgi:cAMP-dependent protein kinase regulator
MDEYERSKLCDGLQELKVKAGDVVIKQNDPGDRFFMISEGILKASIVEKQGAAPKEVYDLKSGDYFGELALINNAPRKATVTANTDCQLLFVDTEAFKRLMGPLEEILKRNAARYEKHV